MDIPGVDPEMVEAVLRNASDYLDAQRRIEKIVHAGEKKLASAEDHMAKQIAYGVAEEGAVEEYVATSEAVSAEIKSQMKSLIKEHEEKYRSA